MVSFRTWKNFADRSGQSTEQQSATGWLAACSLAEQLPDLIRDQKAKELLTSSKNVSLQQCGGQDFSQYIAAHELSDGNIDYHEGKRDRNTISVLQDQGDDDCIGQDRRYRNQPAVKSEQVSKYRTNQGCYTPKDDVQEDSSAQDISQETTNEEPRDRCRCKERQDSQRFGDSDLDRPKRDWCKYHGQHDV